MEEKRTKLEVNNVTKVFFEAKLQPVIGGYPTVITKNRMEDLQMAIEVYTRDGKYKLVSAEKVEEDHTCTKGGGVMYLNGYNREKVMEVIRKENKGYRAGEYMACKYLAEDGNKCIVGCFIPPDKYDSRMEDASAKALLDGSDMRFGELQDKKDPFGIAKFMPMDSLSLVDIQSFHDDLDDAEGEDFYNLIEEQLEYIEQRRGIQ